MRPNKLIFGQDERVAAWVARQLKVTPWKDCRAVAVVSADNRPLGAVVYHAYYPEFQTIEISGAMVSPMFAQEQTIRDLLAIPFDGYKVRKVRALTRIDNLRAQKFMTHVGMKREAVLRHEYAQGVHAVVYGMMAGQYATKWRLKEAA